MGNKTKHRPYRVIPLSTIKERLFNIHGTAISIVGETYTGVKNKATFIDERGPWNAFVYNILNGGTRGNPRLTIEDIKERLFKIHGTDVSLVEDTYISTKKSATFIHHIHGPWSANVGILLLMKRNHPKVFLDKLRLTRQEVEEKLKDVHGDVIKIVWDTFVNTHTKAIFVHSIHGRFSSQPYHVLAGGGPLVASAEKIRLTNLKKYGTEHSSQNKEVALRTAKSANNSTILFHWKTGEEIVCRASYEPAVVRYLNINKIEYLWQPEIFVTPILTKMGRNSTYCPDLFLINENKWIEIKGFFRDDAKAKWDWFKTQFPTAELWNEKKLKEMGIL